MKQDDARQLVREAAQDPALGGARAVLITHVDDRPVDPFEVEISEAECVEVGAGRKVKT